MADIGTWTVYPTKNVDSKPSEYRINYSVNLNELKAIFFGGLNENLQPINTLETYDLTTYNWEKIIPKGPSPQPRHAHTSQVVDNKLIVIGGTNKSDLFIKDQCFYDVWIFDFVDKLWQNYSLQGQVPLYLAYTYSALLSASNYLLLFWSDPKKPEMQTSVFDLNKVALAELPVATMKPKIKFSSGFFYNSELQQCLFFGGFDYEKPDPQCISNEIESLQLFEAINNTTLKDLELYNSESSSSKQLSAQDAHGSPRQ